MNFNVNIDWKFVGALGLAFAGSVFAFKLDPDAVERVTIRAIDSYSSKNR